MALLVGNALLQSGLALLLAHSIGRAVDRALPLLGAQGPGGQPSMDALLPLLFLPVLIAILLAVLQWRERVDAEILAQAYVHRIRRALLEQLQLAAPEALRSRSRGGLLLRFIGDVSALGNWVSRGLVRLVTAGVTVTGVSIGLALHSASYALLVPLTLIPAAAIVLLLSATLDARLNDHRNQRARLATRVSSHLTRMDDAAPRDDAAAASRQLLRVSGRVRDAAVNVARLSGVVDATMTVLARLAPLALLCIGAAQRGGQSSTTAGEIAALISLATILTVPLRDLGRVQDLWRRARLSRAKLKTFLSLPARLEAGVLQPTAGSPWSLVLTNLPIPNASSELSLSAGARERVRLAGASPALRVTLLAALRQRHLPTVAELRIDGLRLAEIEPAALQAGLHLIGRKDGAWTRYLTGAPSLLWLDDAELPSDEFSRLALLRTLANFPSTLIVVSDDTAWDRVTTNTVHLPRDVASTDLPRREGASS